MTVADQRIILDCRRLAGRGCGLRSFRTGTVMPACPAMEVVGPILPRRHQFALPHTLWPPLPRQ